MFCQTTLSPFFLPLSMEGHLQIGRAQTSRSLFIFSKIGVCNYEIIVSTSHLRRIKEEPQGRAHPCLPVDWVDLNHPSRPPPKFSQTHRQRVLPVQERRERWENEPVGGRAVSDLTWLNLTSKTETDFDWQTAPT